uniref:Uncharacterized protein n=1 Tax=Avena sativa TaxID=4498 RepID=A0ACD5X5U7_AVESA
MGYFGIRVSLTYLCVSPFACSILHRFGTSVPYPCNVDGVKICTKIAHPVVEQLRKEDREATEAATNSAPKNQLIKLPSYENSSLPPSSKKRKGKQSNIADSFTAEERHTADSNIARMFYTRALPFNLARNSAYRASYSYVANTKLGGYVPPSYDALRSTLLQKEKVHVEKMLQPIKDTWPFKGVSIAMYGWSDPQRRPILNSIAMTEGGPMFLKAINTEGEVKSKEYIFDRLREVIEEVGSKNVVQVITNNASNCKYAGLKIEGHYKNIFWTPCVVHTLNLAMKDICDPKNNEGGNAELTWIKQAGEGAFYIKNYIMNHSMRLSMFNVFSKLKFLAIAETRFASLLYHAEEILKQWWGTYGVHAPELKDLALMLLGQPSSSSCCERNWSTYSFIHSLKRNRLNPGRAEDLVFVHNNLRLLSRKSKDYENGPSRMWDVGGDGLDSFDGVGILEGADLALDEPEFEQEMVGEESI